MQLTTLIDVRILAATNAELGKVIPPVQWWITAAVVLLLTAGLLGFVYLTRAGVIARATTKEAIRQPVFVLLLCLGFVVLLVNTFLPFFSLGEDIKMLKDCGLATILISGLLLAVWTSSTSIADEIEGKTAMTLLSKPINRRQFIVGKYVGILQAALWLVIPLVVAFFGFLYYKVGYDARESTQSIPPYIDWSWKPAWLGGVRAIPLPEASRLAAVLQIIPGLLLICLEIAVLAAVSVAISTRVPMVVNMVSCLAIFVIGHLTPVLVKAQVLGLEQVEFVARLVATILPSLEIFNMQAAVATGTMVPPDYLGLAALYGAAYCAAAILLAFILFEDRDLA
jgi:ABC-type transport system involved in multi-copper enzyme maturation permease subunit